MRKATPVELGNRGVVEDQHGFMHHKIMRKQTDDQVAVPIIQETKANTKSYYM